MAHIYLLFDFANDEAKAQHARQKLEGWKQAFRLDKKLLYKFERIEVTSSDNESVSGKSGVPASETQGKQTPAAKAGAAAKPEKGRGKGKAKSSANIETEAAPAPAKANQTVKLLVRLGFSNHEKLSEQRWMQRIPSEEPFSSAAPAVVKLDDARFEDTERHFDELT